MKNISIIIVSLNTRQDFIKTIQSVTKRVVGQNIMIGIMNLI